MLNWRSVRIDYFTDPPESLTVCHFASGSSAIGDMRGFSRILYPFGVTASDLRPNALAELVSFAHLPIRVFVDSGAFSEVEMCPRGPTVVRPIEPAEWVRRLRTARIIAAAFAGKAVIVAPDQVGSQQETLLRLERHADAIRGIRATGALIVVPIQCGKLSPWAFDDAAKTILGFDDFARGLPGNKAAMSTNDVTELVRRARPGSVHVLGMGPHNQRFRELIHACREASPSIEISCDSNLIAAHVGKANGRDGEARALTAAEQLELDASGERSREAAIVYAFGPAAIFRRTIQNSKLGPSDRFRGVGAVPRMHGSPVVVAEFGIVQPPAKQLDLFAV